MNELYMILESYDDIQDDYEYGLITESEYTEYMMIIETAWDDWLKEHDYDPKTKTVKINGSRVKLNRDEESAGMYYKGKRTHDYDDVDAARKDLKKKGMSGRVSARLGAANKSMLDSAKGGKLKAYHINVNDAEMHKSSRDDIDFTMQHEYGHVKDVSYARKVNREPDFFKKYNSSVVPKELRGEYIEWKKKIRDKGGEDKLSIADKTKWSLFKGKIKEKSDVYKKDKNSQLADNYKDFDTKTKLYLGLHNRKGHANSPDEIKADIYAKRHTNKSYKDQKKHLDDTVKKYYDKTISDSRQKLHNLKDSIDNDDEVSKKRKILAKGVVKAGDALVDGIGTVGKHNGIKQNKKRMKDNEKMDKVKSSSYLSEMVQRYLTYANTFTEAVSDIQDDYIEDVITYEEYNGLIDIMDYIYESEESIDTQLNEYFKAINDEFLERKKYIDKLINDGSDDSLLKAYKYASKGQEKIMKILYTKIHGGIMKNLSHEERAEHMKKSDADSVYKLSGQTPANYYYNIHRKLEPKVKSICNKRGINMDDLRPKHNYYKVD